MVNTKRSLYEIETALAKSPEFDFRKNIVAFNVNGWSEKLPIWHECDMLICSKSGYLTEIEIKRSWTDFLADFKKKHNHDSEGLIKFFYYCIPESLYERVRDYLCEKNFYCSGIITYNEDLIIEKRPIRINLENGEFKDIIGHHPSVKKLFIEQQLEIARLGAMRVIGLKDKITMLKNEKIKED